jgi:hypothetical protein
MGQILAGYLGQDWSISCSMVAKLVSILAEYWAKIGKSLAALSYNTVVCILVPYRAKIGKSWQ